MNKILKLLFKMAETTFLKGIFEHSKNEGGRAEGKEQFSLLLSCLNL